MQNQLIQKSQDTSYITTSIPPYKMFLPKAFHLECSLPWEFSYEVYMLIHLITAKSGLILKRSKGKNIHLNSWNFGTSMKKCQKQCQKPTAFLANTYYGWVQWTFPGFLNVSCHISICFFTITWRKYYELCLSYNVLINTVKTCSEIYMKWGKVHGVNPG